MRTRKVDVVEDYHGTAVADPYRWLENAEHPEVKEWVRAQRRLTEGFGRSTNSRRDQTPLD